MAKTRTSAKAAVAAVSLALFPLSAVAGDAASLTVGTPALRRAAETLPDTPLSTPIDWFASLPLPDIRLRMALETPLDPRHPTASLDALGLRAVEVRVPTSPYLWLGVEDAPDDPTSPYRATLSLQRDF